MKELTDYKNEMRDIKAHAFCHFTDFKNADIFNDSVFKLRDLLVEARYTLSAEEFENLAEFEADITCTMIQVWTMIFRIKP